jgi:hypothetical protein
MDVVTESWDHGSKTFLEKLLNGTFLYKGF